MIAAHLRMRKIAGTESERDNEQDRGRKREKEGECVTTLKKMPATRTKIKMITYPAADVRALRVTHAYTYATYRRSSEDGMDETGVRRWGGRRGIGVCRDAGPLPRCFVI